MTPNAIGQVVVGRLCIAFCCVIFPSVMMKYIGAARPVQKMLTHSNKNVGRVTDVSLTILSVGACLAGSVPLALAIFPQKVEVDVDTLPKVLKEQIQTKYPGMRTVYYNKGL